MQKSRRCDILIVGSYEVITLPSAVRPVGAGRAFFYFSRPISSGEVLLNKWLCYDVGVIDEILSTKGVDGSIIH